MSEARGTYVSIYLKDEATKHLQKIDKLVGEVERNFMNLGQEVDDSTTGFSSLSRQVTGVNRGLDQSANASNSLQREITGVNQQAINANNSFGGIATTVAGIATTLGAVVLGGGIVSTALEMEDAFAKLEARTGATGQQLAQYEGIAKDIFINGFTDNIGDATNSVSAFAGMFQNLDTKQLAAVTEGAHTISKAWDYEAQEVGKTVATMSKTFEGLGETQALDLMQTALKETGGNDEIIEVMQEYSTQFKALGYDAEGFTATLIAGSKSGVFSFDKLADTAKEGFLKLGEGSKDTRNALTAMGLNADQVISGIGQGGDEAQKSFMAVSSALATIEDPAKRNQLAIAAFGTPLEDLGPQFSTFFGSVNQNLGDFEGATQQAANAMHDTFGHRMQTVWRDLGTSIVDSFNTEGMQTFLSAVASDVERVLPSIKDGFSAVGEAISNNVMPVYEKFKTGLSWLMDNKDIIISVGTGIGTAFAVFKGAEMAKGVFDVVKGFSLVGALTNPIGIAAVAIGGLVAAGVWLYQNWDTVTEKVAIVKDNISNAWTQIKDNVGGAVDQVCGFFTNAKDKAVGLWEAIKQNPMMLSVVGPIGTVIGAGITLYQNWDTIKTKAGELWNAITEKFAGIKNSVSNFVQPAIGWFDNLSGKWNDFKSAISNFKVPEWMSTVGSTISTGISKVKNWVGADGSHATGLANVGWDGYRAELHKGESVLTAAQSDTLRGMGILSSNGDGTPNIDLSPLNAQVTPTSVTPVVTVNTNTTGGSGKGTPINVVNHININAHGKTDDTTIQNIRSMLDNEVRRVFEDIFRGKLAGLEG